MRTRYSQGPWTLQFGDGWCNIVAPDGHGYIATVKIRPTQNFCYTEMEANARLLAHAPDMVEKLLSLLRLCNSMNGRQHAGTAIDDGAWSELERLANEADALLSQILRNPQGKE
jgi:hypothetical protein